MSILKTLQCAVMALLAVGFSGTGTSAWAQQPSEQGRAEQALALRFGTLASSVMRGATIEPHQWHQNAILLQAAHRLDPQEPRYLRLLLENYRQTGRFKEAAATALKLVGLERNNIGAQVLTIDMSLAGMETLDQRLAYLETILSARWPAETRSHAATLKAALQIERAEPDKAQQTLRTALELNPVNPRANQLYAQLAAPQASDLERARIYLRLLTASPRDINAAAALGDALAELGMGDTAILAYNHAVSLSMASSQPVSPQLATQVAAAHFVLNENQASALLDQILAAQPDNISARFLQLLVYADSRDSAPAKKAFTGLRVALLNQLNHARSTPENTIAPIAYDTATLPPLPDLSADEARFQQAGDAERAAFIKALADLAWMELYFSGPSADTQKLIDALRTVAPADHLALARLDGWNFLLQNKPDEARVKLSAIAEQDPLSALGLLRLYGNDDASVRTKVTEGRQLLSDNPTGLPGAFIAYEMRKLRVRVEQKPEATELVAEATRLMQDVSALVQSPHTFYLLRAEPLQIAHDFGTPLLARVTLQNISQYDLSIGEFGAIQPDLWFDARVRGIHQQVLPGVAYDRLIQHVVLKKQASISQIVRLDQGQLRSLLESNPAVGMPITFYVTTNPTGRAGENGQQIVVAGAAGQTSEFLRIMERTAMPIFGVNTRDRVLGELRTAAPDIKLRRLDLIYSYTRALMANRNVGESEQQAARELARRVNQLRDDRSAPVKAWASFLSSTLIPAEQRPDLARLMRVDPVWYSRLLSLVILSNDLPTAQAAAKSLVEDPEAIVREFAQVLIDIQPADTAPATQP